MMYELRIDLEAAEFLSSQDEKTKRIIKNNLEKLEEEPYPSPNTKSGDKEKATVNSKEIYRMHISRSYTAFYVIEEGDNQVIITDIVDIDTAHKMYD